MATSNRRDVELALRVSTLGEEGIRNLERDIRDLAAGGGAAAPQFEALADEIARLGQQAQALDRLSQAAREVQQLGEQQGAAALSALELQQQLAALEAETRRFAQAEGEARSKLQEAKNSLQAKKDALALLRIETDAAGKKTTDYQTQVAGLKKSILEASQEVRRLAQDHRASKDAAAQAQSAEGALERQYRTATAEAQRSSEALRQRNDSLRTMRGDLAQAGLATEDLAVTSQHLVTALNAQGAAAQELNAVWQRLSNSWDETAAEEQRLAQITQESLARMRAAAKVEADGIVSDFNRMDKAIREAGMTMEQAFGAVGFRNAAEIRAEITRVREAMALLERQSGLTGKELDTALGAGNRRIKELERDLRAATGEVTLMDRATKLLHTTFGHFSVAFVAVQAVQSLATSFVEANKQAESLRLSLNTLYGNTHLAGQQFDFLRAVADRSGVAVGSISEAFVKFSASTKSANMPLEQTNALFSAVTRAAGTLGLSGDKVSKMLDALAQMAGKGVVSMEELRQQLGDSLPGALSLAAQGLGLTDQQLIKLVESGGLLARDLFPALTKALQSMAGNVDTLGGKWERFKNTLNETFVAFGDAGAVDILKGALVGLGAVLGPIALGLVTIFDTVTTSIRVVAVSLAAIVNGDLKNLKGEIQRITDDAVARNVRLSDSYKRLVFGAESVGQAHQGAAQQIGAAASASTSAAGAAASLTTAVGGNTAALQQNAQAAGTAANAQTFAATAAEQAAAKQALAATSIVQISAAYGEQAKALEVSVQAAERRVKAVEIETKSAQAIVEMSGNERAALAAATEAADLNLAALERLRGARENEIGALRNYIAALQEEIRAHGDPGGVRAKQLEEQRKRLELLDAEQQKTVAATNAAKLEVETKKLARQVYEDNSKSLDLLRTVMENAQRTLDGYVMLQKQGFATQEQVTEARIRASQAERLYRDALNDTIRSMEAQRALDAAGAQVKQGLISLDIERSRSLEALAKNIGDENLATTAQIAAKEGERNARLASAAALQKEADAMVQEAEQKRQAALRSGEYTDLKRKEYETAIANADAKRLESERAKESTKTIDQEIDAMRRRAAARLQDAAATREQAKALEELYNRNKIARDESLTNDGFKKTADGSAAGQFNNMLPLDLATRLKETGGRGMSKEEITQAIQQARNAYQDMESFRKLSPGGASIEYQRSVTELQNAANIAQQQLNAGQIGAPRAVASQPTGGAKTINLQINGGSKTAINVADQQSADALTAFLRQLETSKGTSA